MKKWSVQKEFLNLKKDDVGCLMRYLMAETPVQKEFENDKRFRKRKFIFTRYCEGCGAELYGEFKYSEPKTGLYDAIENSEREHARDSKKAAVADYNRAKKIADCPICGVALRTKPGYFLPPGNGIEWDVRSRLEGIEYYDDPCPCLNFSDVGAMFKYMASQREPEEQQLIQKQIRKTEKYIKKSEETLTISNPAPIENVRKSPDELRNYIFTLIQMENNLYSLKKHLSSLYYRRLYNERALRRSDYERTFTIKIELTELQKKYTEALQGIDDAQTARSTVSVDYPVEPISPTLGKPGLFNKKKVLEENEALTRKYQAEMEAYQKEVKRCDEEKTRLISEERAARIEAAQKKVDAAKMALDEAEDRLDRAIKDGETSPAPATIVKEILDKEIAEVEELLKRTYSTRNELYAYNIVFGKYRDVVALSSFYEYLMSGRCTSLEGADGAYNIYENEIRMNLVISQLDTVIASLEEIKQNQYMMYQELHSINQSLDRLNQTMDQALESIQRIDANTEGLAENTRVIAHNTALAAYYSKVNADLTNALGYMVAFS